MKDMIEGIPVARLNEFNSERVSLEQFRERLVRRDFGVEYICTAPLSVGGAASARVFSPGPLGSGASANFRERFYRMNGHRWPPEHLTLLNKPCYLVVATGVVVLEDGRILLDSIYPSTGEKTVSRLIGGGLTADRFSDYLREAETLQNDNWAPLLSRWSNVYFHGVSESMVHDAALSRSGLSGLVRYLAPLRRHPVQDLVVQCASAPIRICNTPVVKVPRLVLSSLLYRHAAMGFDFFEFVQRTKIRSLMSSLEMPLEAKDRIYVARFGARARSMTNEQTLADALVAMGFHIFRGDGLSFENQVRALSGAKLIVGAHGAGLVNAAFARPGATLFELRPLNRAGESPMWTASYLRLSSIMGFAYCTHVSENEPDSEVWTANIDEITSSVRGLIS